jgi:hypothetical protein
MDKPTELHLSILARKIADLEARIDDAQGRSDTIKLGLAPMEAVVRAAIEWRAARISAVADISHPGAWDRLAKAEHMLSGAVSELTRWR